MRLWQRHELTRYIFYWLCETQVGWEQECFYFQCLCGDGPECREFLTMAGLCNVLSVVICHLFLAGLCLNADAWSILRTSQALYSCLICAARSCLSYHEARWCRFFDRALDGVLHLRCWSKRTPRSLTFSEWWISGLYIRMGVGHYSLLFLTFTAKYRYLYHIYAKILYVSWIDYFQLYILLIRRCENVAKCTWRKNTWWSKNGLGKCIFRVRRCVHSVHCPDV